MPSDCIQSYSIGISGTDICIGGANTSYAPTVWKNGVGTALPMTSGHNEGTVMGAFVSGTDVYMAGSDNVNGANSAPRLWKNGVAQPLAYTDYGNTFNVFVSGTDVYVCGDQFFKAGTGYSVATVWKNGWPRP
jgi:hypothetical protein